jgi:hypothetical protein
VTGRKERTRSNERGLLPPPLFFPFFFPIVCFVYWSCLVPFLFVLFGSSRGDFFVAFWELMSATGLRKGGRTYRFEPAFLFLPPPPPFFSPASVFSLGHEEEVFVLQEGGGGRAISLNHYFCPFPPSFSASSSHLDGMARKLHHLSPSRISASHPNSLLSFLVSFSRSFFPLVRGDRFVILKDFCVRIFCVCVDASHARYKAHLWTLRTRHVFFSSSSAECR